jgi:hypothetical protein
MTEPHRRPARTLILALALTALAGCGRQSTGPKQAATKQADPYAELTQSAQETFRKSGDLATCRSLVEQLNRYLGRGDPVKKPEALPGAREALLKNELSLTDEEVAEVGRQEFTPLDAYWLHETILFRDVARALDVGGLPAADRARAALEWVVTNLRPVEHDGPALPPSYCALRGGGTTLERTYALLRLLHQLDLDYGLVGDESAAQSPNGVWAVGVLADGQILLFDVRLGLPLPGPDGKGTLTLAQARTEAEPFRPLAADARPAYDVTPDRARKSQVFLTAPLTALAPRMTFLQGLVPAAARLDYDAAAARDRFQKAMQGPVFEGCAVRFWNPPVVDAYPRVLHAFIPAPDGGGDRSPPGRRHMDRYHFEAVPWRMLPPFLVELQGEPGARVRSLFADRALLFTQPGRPRDLILRGQFDEATRQLVELQGELTRRPHTEKDVDETARLWAKTAREFYANLARQERAGNLAEVEDQKSKIDILWQRSHGLNFFLAYLLSEPLLAETTYLLGVCKHEQALRLAYRGEPDKDAWQTAARWWAKFVSDFPEHPAVPSARRNLGRAQEGAGRTVEARAAYDAVAASDAPEPMKLACKYLAGRLK